MPRPARFPSRLPARRTARADMFPPARWTATRLRQATGQSWAAHRPELHGPGRCRGYGAMTLSAPAAPGTLTELRLGLRAVRVNAAGIHVAGAACLHIQVLATSRAAVVAPGRLRLRSEASSTRAWMPGLRPLLRLASSRALMAENATHQSKSRCASRPAAAASRSVRPRIVGRSAACHKIKSTASNAASPRQGAGPSDQAASGTAIEDVAGRQVTMEDARTRHRPRRPGFQVPGGVHPVLGSC
jgi:hypothetical protein